METRPTVGTTYLIACYVSGLNMDGHGGIEVTIDIGGELLKIPLVDWQDLTSPKGE